MVKTGRLDSNGLVERVISSNTSLVPQSSEGEEEVKKCFTGVSVTVYRQIFGSSNPPLQNFEDRYYG